MWTNKSAMLFTLIKTTTRNDIFIKSELTNSFLFIPQCINRFYRALLPRIEISHISVQRLWFSAQKQWAIFKISNVDLDPVSVKCGNVKFRYFFLNRYEGQYIFLQGYKISHAFVQRSRPSDHEQKLILASALKTLHDTIGIIGPMLPSLVRCQLSWVHYGTINREVAIINPDFVVIGPKSVRWSPLCPLRQRMFPEHLGLLGGTGHAEFKRMLIVFGHWTMTVALTRVTCHIFQNKYIRHITDSIDCPKCSFSHFADTVEVDIGNFKRCSLFFGHWNVIAGPKICDISHILRTVVWLHS